MTGVTLVAVVFDWRCFDTAIHVQVRANSSNCMLAAASSLSHLRHSKFTTAYHIMDEIEYRLS